MSNHFHILLEVPPKSAEGVPEKLLLERLRALYSKGRVAVVAKELEELRKRKGMRREQVEKELKGFEKCEDDLAISRVVRHRVRYFSDGVVIGGREFVDEFFRDCRDRFGVRRKSGARKPRGALSELSGSVWTARDLRTGVG